jgi:hypothetical protein
MYFYCDEFFLLLNSVLRYIKNGYYWVNDFWQYNTVFGTSGFGSAKDS